MLNNFTTMVGVRRSKCEPPTAVFVRTFKGENTNKKDLLQNAVYVNLFGPILHPMAVIIIKTCNLVHQIRHNQEPKNQSRLKTLL
jgi:hypothetical protein